MKRALRILIRLYPAWWRRRYGRELEALLEDSGSGWGDVWDVLLGAMEMQMSRWSFGRIVMVSGIAGVVLASAVAFSMPYRYRSTAILKTSSGRSAEEWDALSRAAFTPQALSDITHREQLYSDAAAEDVIDRMRRAIRLERTGPNMARVSFAYEDSAKAQRTSRDLVDRMIVANLSTRGNPNGLLLELVVPADRPQRQIERKRYGLAGLGLPAGLLLGVALALIFRQRTPAAN